MLNQIITKSISILPKWFAKPFAKAYVAGETNYEAIERIKILNQKGYSATLDILGEHTLNKNDSKKYTDQYLELYQEIYNNKLDCNISIKPTHIGLDISFDEALKNFMRILKASNLHKNFLRIDMEDSKHTNDTFKLYQSLKNDYSGVGVVVQAYLKRSLRDLEKLHFLGLNARICKGIYNEDSSIAYKNKNEINDNFIKIANFMAKHNCYAGYATHDYDLIEKLIENAKKRNLKKSQFEFQVLFGVPMEIQLEDLLKRGYKVRIYVPFGPNWFDYSIRRIKENPKIIKYVLKNILTKSK
tara:strand:+ start:69 stop:968 length:900 start_codon:yes stop_codon:yes gene_type:complete